MPVDTGRGRSTRRPRPGGDPGADRALTKAELDDLIVRGWSEAKFQSEAEEWYFLAGWERVWHDNFSLRNDPGFPDLIACGMPAWLAEHQGVAPHTHWRELKKEGGSVTKDQKAFGAAIQADGGDWAVRYTRDWRLVKEECGLAVLEARAAGGDARAAKFLLDRHAALIDLKRARAAARSIKRARGRRP